jgi:hypothetical protein
VIEIETFIGDYLSKIVTLEEQIGAIVGYKPLEPFAGQDAKFEDIHRLQSAAKKIAEFVGLADLTFIVSIAKQSQNVAGLVELSYSGNDVFVEISTDMVCFENAVLATLAHEITHKYMHIHRIARGVGIAHEYENEVFTDITTVFLGLGKLMLNGAEQEKSRQEVKLDGTHHITETYRCGYLNQQQLAIAYRIICAMRGISRRDMLSSLSPQARSTVLSCDGYHARYLDPRFGTDAFRDKLLHAAMKQIKESLVALDGADEGLQFIQEACVSRVEVFLRARRERLVAMQNNVASLGEYHTYDPCLKFLNSIQLKEWAGQMQSEARHQSVDIVKVAKRLKKLRAKIQKLGWK